MSDKIKQIFAEIDNDLRALKAMSDMDLQRSIIADVNEKLKNLKKLWESTNNKT